MKAKSDPVGTWYLQEQQEHDMMGWVPTTVLTAHMIKAKQVLQRYKQHRRQI
jgi:hypothetical protein